MGQSQGLPVPEDSGGRSQASEKPLEVGGAPCRLGSQQLAPSQGPGRQCWVKAGWAGER